MRSDTVLNINHNHSPPYNEGSSLQSQLARTKEDLELVSYVMSHDLKNPIRSIAASCESIKGLPDISTNFFLANSIEKIEGESLRLKTLMQGVLDYLSLETYSPTFSPINSREIIDTALTILKEEIQATGAKIIVEPLPEIYGHRGRITRLFVYILGNALKFKSSVNPFIKVFANHAPYSNFLEFTIEDNGIGIEEEYNEIIFQLFQRLHPQGQYPGEGIGLALCKKIVESHGGKLWMKPGSAAGSRFCFTLPATGTEK